MTAETEQVLIAAFKQGQTAAPVLDLNDGRQVIVLPDGAQTKVFEAHDPKLLRVVQRVELHDSDSFVAYVDKYKTDDTRIFAEPGFLSRSGNAGLHCVFDYHGAEPGHKAHHAVYTPRYSEQWLRWQAVCQKPLAQAEFAEFIEEVRADIVSPDAAQLMDIVRTFKGNKKVDYDSVTYQPNGSVKLNYSEHVTQTGESGNLPETMQVGIPVYFRGERFGVNVFVRYRISGGGVTFQLKLVRADIIEDEAFNTLADQVGGQTGVDTYLGRLA